MTLEPRRQWGRWPWVEQWCWPLVHPVRFYKLRRYIKQIPGMPGPDLNDRLTRVLYEIGQGYPDKEENPK